MMRRDRTQCNSGLRDRCTVAFDLCDCLLLSNAAASTPVREDPSVGFFFFILEVCVFFVIFLVDCSSDYSGFFWRH